MTTTVPFTLYVPDVIMHAPNCPEFTAVHAIRLTVTDFCTKTHWWKYKSDPLDLEAGEKEYQIEVPNGAEPVAVTAAWYLGRPLWPLGYSAKNKWQVIDLDLREGPPQAFSQSDTENLILSPVPRDSESGALVIECALRPKRNATGAGKDLLDRWDDAIVNGTLARLYAIPNQPYTNHELAKMRDKMYREDVTLAKIDANKSLTTASLRVQPRQP